MSKRKEKPEQISPPDSLTKTSKKGSVELTELGDKDLDKVTGGTGRDAGIESLTLVHEGSTRTK